MQVEVSKIVHCPEMNTSRFFWFCTDLRLHDHFLISFFRRQAWTIFCTINTILMDSSQLFLSCFCCHWPVYSHTSFVVQLKYHKTFLSLLMPTRMFGILFYNIIPEGVLAITTLFQGFSSILVLTKIFRHK